MHSVANFLRVEEYRVAMIEFDANNFFRVIQRLFANRPWEFMLQWHACQKDGLPEPEDLITMLATEV